MFFLVNELYEPDRVQGPRQVSFSDIAVSGSDGGPDSAFILLSDTYLARNDRLRKALELGSRVLIGKGFPAELSNDPTHTLIRVDDPLKELIRLTSMLRHNSRATFIGVTGSSGKTTTKDMITHLFRGRFKNTLKTFRNYNGLLGIPLTMRKLRDDDRFAVLEIGLGDPGSVDRGAALVRPHVAVVTNIGESHMGLYKDLSAIAREKSALLRHLEPGGLAVLNGDDPYCREMQRHYAGKTLLFGWGPECDIRIISAKQVAYDHLEVSLCYGRCPLLFKINAVGGFQAYNAAAATAVALQEGLSPGEISKRFLSFSASEQRMKTYVKDGLLIVDDGYNASPQGMRVSVAAFAQIPWPGPRVLIIGDPQDQGELSGHYLSDMANILAEHSHHLLIWVGRTVAPLAATVPGSQHAATVEQAVAMARRAIPQGGAIFIKGTDDKLLKALRLQLLL